MTAKKTGLNSALYEEVDLLEARWKELESLLKGPPFAPEGSNLSMDRHGQDMRLLYRGRPLVECTLIDRIEAVEEVEAFIIEVSEYREGLKQRTVEARVKVEKFIRLLSPGILPNGK
jgi:hypothetical protein